MNTMMSHAHPIGWSFALGILLMFAGLIAIAAPAFAGIAASVFFGWLISIAGVAHLVFAWSHHRAEAVMWQILIGVLYISAGFYMLFQPLAGMSSLALVLGIYITFEGILELIVFSHLRRIHGAVWYLIDGLISLALGALIFFHWPSSPLWLVGTLVGISLLFSGIARTVGHATWGLPGLTPLTESPPVPHNRL